MSNNVIKAAAVTYTQEVRTIDSNEREGGFTRLAVDKLAQVKEDAGTGDLKDFEPGIKALFADRNGEGVPGAEAFVAALDEDAIKALEEQAKGIIAEAREEVLRILNDAKAQAENIRKKAYEDGLRQGEKAGRDKYDALSKRLEGEVKAAKEAYEKQEKELEPLFADILIGLLKKLTGVLLEDKRGIVVYLLEQALSDIEPGMTYLVHVSGEDFESVSSKKSELLWKLKEGAELEIVEDRTMKKGQCIIETDSRIFDCGVDTQLKNLVGDLRLLAGSREG
ncbi:MAG: hypothetical protein K2O03_00680 [Lachnospiraceae bacterium]|nr:hypothetical protein [Lachnospiraceae bacterium]